ncbi:DUF2178 domain-containing protein [Haloarchaeobius amylolyticus]|uniref:DUF2178 domain-containing protein n=1 Tax=Haloarchaeobius amylolyticus TaxID=1198296 RepID=UPI00226F8CA8|nr:DUF2178 domain-containing protein [Haloarchaeobius amylolyticus]
MTLTETDATDELTYRRLYIGLWILSGVALGALVALGEPLAGVAAFVACAVGALVLFRRYSGPLFDERDQRQQEAASQRTLAIMGMSSAVVFPTVTALWGLGIIEWPVWLTPIAFFVAALSFVHVGSTMYEASNTA